jgi:hypothetical protein
MERDVATAIGNRLPDGFEEGHELDGSPIKLGRPPVVLETQAFAYVPLERPEQLKQWEDDLRTFYGVSLDASRLGGHACETCSCGCTDDCGMIE